MVAIRKTMFAAVAALAIGKARALDITITPSPPPRARREDSDVRILAVLHSHTGLHSRDNSWGGVALDWEGSGENGAGGISCKPSNSHELAGDPARDMNFIII